MGEARAQLILPAEIAAVETALKKHPKSRHYRLAVKGDKIIIYEGNGPDIKDFSDLLGIVKISPAEFAERIETEWTRYTQFIQVMRFILDDAKKRTFRTERW